MKFTKKILFLIWLMPSILFSQYLWVTVSDTFTLADSCGCDTCSFGTECDSLRSAIEYPSAASCDDSLISTIGADRIWLNDNGHPVGWSACGGNTHIRVHFVDTFLIADSLFPFPCGRPKL